MPQVQNYSRTGCILSRLSASAKGTKERHSRCREDAVCLFEKLSPGEMERTELSSEVHRPPKHPLARDNLPSRVPPKKNPMKSSAKMKGRPCVRSTFANPSPRQMVVEKFPDVVLEIHKARISNL
ncbi:hypothetical protein HZH68_013725 [Vespula germanica]|uniref:Uncharacterized protein n=1 Tax=Vespula germanica TaxID=30212 RepID=A0A834MUU1_VESGE|nr:hypothetical protein HZH68_013725 [Vespula germanica]